MSKVTATYSIDSKEYTLTELTHGDWISLQKYIQYRNYTILKKDVEQMPEVETLLPDVLKECATNPITMDQLQQHMALPDVMAEFVYLSLRHYHQGIEHQEVEEILTINAVAEIIPLIMGLSGIVDDGSDSKKKATPKRQRKKPS